MLTRSFQAALDTTYSIWQHGRSGRLCIYTVIVQKYSKSTTSNEVLYRTSSDLEWENISSQHATFSDV